MFESRRGHIWRLFHLWLRFITVGGRSAHLAYHVHKSGRKTSIIIIILIYHPGSNYTRIMPEGCSIFHFTSLPFDELVNHVDKSGFKQKQLRFKTTVYVIHNHLWFSKPHTELPITDTMRNNFKNQGHWICFTSSIGPSLLKRYGIVQTITSRFQYSTQ